ncbi:S-adenosyl-L-methionine-dependent methyltransferase [Ramaria rubella]|nr:S-adenosyl-L-methionine-dependent methyltransferase [Ramaria rubella]
MTNVSLAKTYDVLTYEEPACMLVVSDAKIADLLLDKPEGVHVDELAKKSSLDAGKLGRGKGFFSRNDGSDVTTATLSEAQCPDRPFDFRTDECLQSTAYLNAALTDSKSGRSVLPQDAAFQRAHGYAFFDYYGTPEGKKRHDRFAQAMIGWGQVTGEAMLPKVYPWGTLSENTVICDVGGGNGHVTLALARDFPHLKIAVQDLPAVIEQSKEHWGKELPEAVQNQIVAFAPVDFFKEAPVPGCDFYYLRYVLHDWPLSECLTILGNVRKSMKPSSKLLIHEFILQHIVRDQAHTTGFEQAPEPLLPNYGMGRVRLYNQDINMMGIMNSKERTLQEFIDMCNLAGFKFVKMWDVGEADLFEEHVHLTCYGEEYNGVRDIKVAPPLLALFVFVGKDKISEGLDKLIPYVEEFEPTPLNYAGPPAAHTILERARHNPTEVLAVRVYCEGDKKQLRVQPFVQVFVPKNHSVFTTQALPVSTTLALPLVMQREGSAYSARADLDCQMATYMAIDTRSGLAPLEWQSRVGTVIIARQDRKPLLCQHFEAFLTYNDEIIDILGVGGRAQRLTRTAFIRWWHMFRESTLEARELFASINGGEAPKDADDWREVPSPYDI